MLRQEDHLVHLRHTPKTSTNPPRATAWVSGRVSVSAVWAPTSPRMLRTADVKPLLTILVGVTVPSKIGDGRHSGGARTFMMMAEASREAAVDKLAVIWVRSGAQQGLEEPMLGDCIANQVDTHEHLMRLPYILMTSTRVRSYNLCSTSSPASSDRPSSVCDCGWMVILQNVPADDALESEDGLMATTESTIFTEWSMNSSRIADPSRLPLRNASAYWAE